MSEDEVKYWDEVEALLKDKLAPGSIAEAILVGKEITNSIKEYQIWLSSKDSLDFVYHFDADDTSNAVYRSVIFWNRVKEVLLNELAINVAEADKLIKKCKENLDDDIDINLDDFFERSPKAVASSIAPTKRMPRSQLLPKAVMPKTERKGKFTLDKANSYAESMSSTILPRAKIFFSLLAKNGSLTSSELATQLHVKRTTNLPAFLTKSLKNAARKAETTEPFATFLTPRTRYTLWKIDPVTAEYILEAISKEEVRRGLKYGEHKRNK